MSDESKDIERHEGDTEDDTEDEERERRGARDVWGNEHDFSEAIAARREQAMGDLNVMRERFKEETGEVSHPGYVVIPSGDGALDALGRRPLPFVTPTSDLEHLVLSPEPLTMEEADEIRDKSVGAEERERRLLEERSPEALGEVAVGEHVGADLLGIEVGEWEEIKAALGSGLGQLALEGPDEGPDDGPMEEERPIEIGESYTFIRTDSDMATRDLTAAATLGLRVIQQVPGEDWVLASGHMMSPSDVRDLWETRHLDPTSVNEAADVRLSTHLGEEVYPSLHPCMVGCGSDIEAFLDAASNANYHFVDVDPRLLMNQIGDADDIKHALQERGLRIGSLKFPVDFRGERSKFSDDIREFSDIFLPLAQALGVRKFDTYLPPVSQGDDYRQIIIDRLGAINVVLTSNTLRYEVNLALEWVSPTHKREDGEPFIYRADQAVDLLSEVAEVDEVLRIGLLVDLFHCHVAGHSPDEIADLPKHSIVHVHINDAPDVPLDDQRDLERCIPGDGVIDIPAYIDAIQATGYRGAMGTEIFGTELHHLPPTQAAKRARVAVLDAIRGI